MGRPEMVRYPAPEVVWVNREELVQLAGLHALVATGADAVPQDIIARRVIV